MAEDAAEGFEWIWLAASHDDWTGKAQAIEARDACLSHLTREQSDEDRRRAAQFQAKPANPELEMQKWPLSPAR
ncbi:MAG: hypothetical protein ACYDH9_03600 [Limisphaerales bacterium]